MRKYLRPFLFTVVILLVCFPVGFVLTFLLSPLWSWIESTYGIESVGHSGPADWCFWTVYAALAVASLAISFRVWRSSARARLS